MRGSKAQAVRLGQKISRMRRDRQLTQAAIGRVCGVHRNTVYRWEKGLSVPSIVHWLRLKRHESESVRQASAGSDL